MAPISFDGALRPVLSVWISIAAIVLVSLGWWLLSGSAVLSEGGPVEVATALTLLLCAALSAQRGLGLHLVAGFLLLAAREFDADKRFTSEGLLQLRLYSGDSPLAEKLLGVLVIGIALWAIWRLLRNDFGGWRGGVRSGHPAAWSVMLAFALVVVAKSLDGLARKLAPLGIDVTAAVSARSGRAEEVLELVFAGLLVYAVCKTAGEGRHAGTEAYRP